MKSKPIYIGLDPGNTGAVALLYPNGDLRVYDFIDPQCLIQLRLIFQLKRSAVACIEHVYSFPGMGAKTVTTFLKSAGRAEGYFEALKIEYEAVSPIKWQKLIYPEGRELTKVPNIRDYPGMGDRAFVSMQRKAQTQRKKEGKALNVITAGKIYPEAAHYLTRVKDHDRADALLIMEYCRRTHEGHCRRVNEEIIVDPLGIG